MCHHCVVESVKQRMLNRRDLFKAGFAAAASAGALTTVANAPAMAATPSKIADMTHTVSDQFPTYFGTPGISMDQKFNFKENGFNLFEMKVNEHTGTHMDAPLHFSADGLSVDEIPVDNLIVPLAVIDIKARAQDNADAEVTPDDIKAWIAKNGPLPDKCCVAMNSGWDKLATSNKYRNADGDGKMHFPGFHIEATKMLLEESTASGMAVDTLSLDHGISADFKTHYAWLPTNHWGIENLANLDEVPAVGGTLVVGAPKHKGGTGGPSRIFTMY